MFDLCQTSLYLCQNAHEYSWIFNQHQFFQLKCFFLTADKSPVRIVGAPTYMYVPHWLVDRLADPRPLAIKTFFRHFMKRSDSWRGDLWLAENSRNSFCFAHRSKGIQHRVRPKVRILSVRLIQSVCRPKPSRSHSDLKLASGRLPANPPTHWCHS